MQGLGGREGPGCLSLAVIASLGLAVAAATTATTVAAASGRILAIGVGLALLETCALAAQGVGFLLDQGFADFVGGLLVTGHAFILAPFTPPASSAAFASLTSFASLTGFANFAGGFGRIASVLGGGRFSRFAGLACFTPFATLTGPLAAGAPVRARRTFTAVAVAFCTGLARLARFTAVA